MMRKSKEILKCFMIVIYMDIFFLGAELMAAYIESKPIKIISCINISCFSILLILTIIKLVRKDNELSMYSSLLLFGCSISWMMPMLLYGSLFGKNTGIVTGILYAISIGIGILIPIVQGKVNKNKPFWIAIRKIAAIFTYAANEDMSVYSEQLCEVLENMALSSDQQEMLDYYISAMRGAQSAIEKLSYNKEVDEFYNRTLRSFPASLFTSFMDIEGPEYFGEKSN